MFFLNLTGPEFFTLLATLGALVSALYLLDRARGRRVVSTLQFWVAAGATDQHQPRRRVRDPWSLLLQLVSLLLLLLATAGFEWGNRVARGRADILLLDTSSWSAARFAESPAETVLTREKQQALAYLAALPATDRVLLVSAGSLAEPVSRFTADRAELGTALAHLQSGYSAFNPEAALAFAAQARNASQNAPGEIAYIGPQLVDRLPTTSTSLTRVISVPADRNNCGIARFTAEPRRDQPHTWQSLVVLKNYSAQPLAVTLDLRFEQTAFAPRHLRLAAGAETSAEYVFTTPSAGVLTASISPADSLSRDDRASLSLPTLNTLRLAVYTDRSALLRPLVASDSELQPEFFPLSAYTPQPAADLAILDSFAPTTAPRVPAIWIHSPKEHSPLPVETSVSDTLISWNASGAKPSRASVANVYSLFENDEALATTAAGAVAVFRPASRENPPQAILGFDPLAGALRFDVATPMLFAALIDRLSPGIFRERLYSAEPVGLVRVALEKAEQQSALRIADERGASIPFTRRANELQVFVSRPATIRITSAGKDRTLDLRLPAVADKNWNPPAAARGIPPFSAVSYRAIQLWRWLACMAALLLVLEWFLFGSMRRRAHTAPRPAPAQTQTERELVAHDR